MKSVTGGMQQVYGRSYRRTASRLAAADILIAVFARRRNAVVVTANERHFVRIRVSPSRTGARSPRTPMPATATESTFELATIDRLQQLGYRYCHGTDINRPTTEVDACPPATSPPTWAGATPPPPEAPRSGRRTYHGARRQPGLAPTSPFTRGLPAVESNLAVDWTQAHRSDVYASVPARSKWCCAGGRFPAIHSDFC